MGAAASKMLIFQCSHLIGLFFCCTIFVVFFVVFSIACSCFCIWILICWCVWSFGCHGQHQRILFVLRLWLAIRFCWNWYHIQCALRLMVIVLVHQFQCWMMHSGLIHHNILWCCWIWCLDCLINPGILRLCWRSLHHVFLKLVCFFLLVFCLYG